MTPASLRALMASAGWSTYKLAELLSVNEGTVKDWLQGRRPVPTPLAEWFGRVERFLRECPVPMAHTEGLALS